MIVVADTSPINYLIQIDQINILATLFGRVFLPRAVAEELSDLGASKIVREWIANPPHWIEIDDIVNADSSLNYLGRGERDGIALATYLRADLILIDEQLARREAENRHFAVKGTLGVLLQAKNLELIDFSSAIQHLQSTSFYVTPALIARLLKNNGE
jgi:predicted nucleic acid-binding protein